MFHVVLFDGCVTVNGPEAESTLSRMPSELIAPPSPRISRSVTLKSIFRVVVGRDSPKVATPERMSDSWGNVRLGLVVGTNERKSGRVPSSVWGGLAVPVSNSSQEYARVSLLSGSLPVAVNVNGVLLGML